ncbi:hypothetical protein [Chthonobacter albigriseus]|uniref:hypothetical protein n=1 Tax=Chthonobacter albigriseus TaxID=1683161 RepID=UPI0015EF66D6|nr:hypothetical protein [Chthonobacter albigriseus]
MASLVESRGTCLSFERQRRIRPIGPQARTAMHDIFWKINYLEMRDKTAERISARRRRAAFGKITAAILLTKSSGSGFLVEAYGASRDDPSPEVGQWGRHVDHR